MGFVAFVAPGFGRVGLNFLGVRSCGLVVLVASVGGLF